MPFTHLSKNLLNLENVRLKLNSEAGEINILRDLNLQINEGEVIAVVGESGSGKTSLLMVIAGLEKISSGRIKLDGKIISDLSEDDLATVRQKNIGIVFQNFHLISTMSAIENIALPLEFLNASNPMQKAAEHLKLLGLCHRATHYPSQLSGGEQQRVAIARAFATQPRILLADEPTGSLDMKSSKKITDLLFQLQQKNKTTLIIVTHSLELAKRCDRIIKLADGCILSSND